MNALPKIKSDDSRAADRPLVSVVISNFNYAAYLADAIDSALQQDYAAKEILVVDDGSTDDSRHIIAGYGATVIPIHKANGGQASALNSGFDASHGDIIFFLDADDLLLPSALTHILVEFSDSGISNVHWPMWVVDSHGKRSGDTRPPQPPGEGDLCQQLLERGPSNLPCCPTSGNAWSRGFLERVLPIPEDVPYYRQCADEYLYTLAPAFGRVRTIVEPQSCYRLHGRNIYSGRTFREKLDFELDGYDQQCSALSAALSRNGITVDVGAWKEHSWFHRLNQAVTILLDTVPEGSTLVLVDGGAWEAAGAFGRRIVRPFLLRNGVDWGPPRDCAAAIAEWESMRFQEAQYLAIAWHCFWWYDAYPRFCRHLEQHADCIVKNDVIAVYKLVADESQRELEYSCFSQEG
jgi:glycosyltransferase involved in cell wall biosynthesis